MLCAKFAVNFKGRPRFLIFAIILPLLSNNDNFLFNDGVMKKMNGEIVKEMIIP